MNHFGSVKCNVYNLGGFKARGYYVGDRGLSHYFDFYKSESIDYYYPNDLLKLKNSQKSPTDILLYSNFI